MRPTRDEWGMDLAVATAKRSTCLRRAVGCVLLDARGRVLAMGYNGVAAGLPHCNEKTVLQPLIPEWKARRGAEPTAQATSYPHACPGAQAPSGTALDSCQALHAEMNAVAFCSDVSKVETCCVTASPCVTCAKLLLGTGCRRVVFKEAYPHPEAKELWTRAGRLWVQL